MEIADGLQWMWTLALTAWVIFRDWTFARRINRQGEDLSGMFKVLGRMHQRLKAGRQP